ISNISNLLNNITIDDSRSEDLKVIMQAMTEYNVYSAVKDDGSDDENMNKLFSEYLLPNAVLSLGAEDYDKTGFPGPDNCTGEKISSDIKNITYTKYTVNTNTNPIGLITSNDENSIKSIANLPLYVIKKGVNLQEVKGNLSAGKDFVRFFKKAADSLITNVDNLVTTKDVLVWQGTSSIVDFKPYNTLTLQFRTLDTKAVNKLIDSLSISNFSESKYLIVNNVNATDNGIYLLEYPVSYIEGFKTEIDPDTSNIRYAPILEISDLRLNIKTGKIVKQRGIDHIKGSGTSTSRFNAHDSRDTSGLNELYKIGAKGESSFTVWDSTGVYNSFGYGKEFNITQLSGDTTASVVDTPTILLLDYLEAVYMPDTISYSTDVLKMKSIKENLVCYGRMIRFDDNVLSGSYTNDAPVVAKYIKPVSGDNAGPTLKITDFADALCLSGHIDENGNSTMNPVVVQLPNRTTDSRDYEDTTGMNLDNALEFPEKIELATVRVGSRIKTSVKFPGGLTDFFNDYSNFTGDNYYSNLVSESDNRVIKEYVSNALIDFEEAFELTNARGDTVVSFSDSINNKPVLYAMAVHNSYSDSGLIDYLTKDEDNYGLNWWIGWLEDNGLSYSKKLSNSVGALNSNIKSRYSYELANNDIVTININTIRRINDEYEADYAEERFSFVRSFFKVLGFALIWYAILLMLAWVLDTNIDLGVRLYHIMSFKTMEAVSSDADVPEVGVSGVRYMGLRNALMTSAGILAIGIVLMLVDVLTLIRILIKLFSDIIRSISNVINGGMKN
ncbi:MAG: hypothetical protein IJ593_07675, partial [Lachnospiraceae bacterium]|nr:hypothetical protein [Lachnospiraceae bacterium]